MISKLKPNEANLIKKIRSINKKRSLSSDDRQINKKFRGKKNEKTEFEVDLDKMTYEEILALEEKIGYVGKGVIQNIEFIPDVSYSLSFAELQYQIKIKKIFCLYAIII